MLHARRFVLVHSLLPVKVPDVLLDHWDAGQCSNSSQNSTNSTAAAVAAAAAAAAAAGSAVATAVAVPEAHSSSSSDRSTQQQGQVASNLKIPSVSRPWLPASFLKQVE